MLKILKYGYNGSEVKEIDDGITAMQAEVDGYCEPIYIPKTNMVIICNEEGRIKNYRPTAIVNMPRREPFVILGEFFVCAYEDDLFTDITPEMITKAEEIITSY